MRGQKKGGKQMSSRTGRPPLQDVSRTEKLNIRLTKAEKQDIEDCAKQLQISRTDTIMKGIGLIKNELNKK